ncbi:hypothetical protein L6452_18768 [Arctium lappa]|uniref:Uncharacterized protein n=1 Tax=Arctium lappa TaxID=4217 RepID=A0ACB9C7D9_ARCLA|nr:hypothetical protein L6452_18768 [Arctium lappa]
MLKEQNERVLSVLAKLLGVAIPVDVEPRTGFQASPFVDEIAMVDVPKCRSRNNIKKYVSIEAYKRGLDKSSGLYTDLTKYPPENFEDVRARTLAYMRVEDDVAFRRKYSNDKKSLSVKKPEFKAKTTVKTEPSRQISSVRFDNKKVSTTTKFPQYPKISSYGFKGTFKDLVEALRTAQATIRWPRKSDKVDDKKDITKWCDFHDDHGHTTDDCIALKKEFAWHVLKGNLKSIFDELETPDNNIRPPSLDHEKIMNYVTGGSDVCGLTYSAAKRHTRQGINCQPIPWSLWSKEELELESMKITFDQDDLSDLHQKHHDGLIIQLKIGNCLTRTFGEITLPVYAKGINKQTRFSVIDCSSTYNIILGRPWIHDMKAVPSTYHKTMKFPTPWGIQEIKSEPKVARDYYKTTMKPRKQSI